MNYYILNHMHSFDQSLPMMLYRALDRVMPAYREIFARFDITEQQWRVLRVIWTSKNVTSRQLADRTLLLPSSLVSIIDRLEKKQLVTRLRSVEDRRAIYIIATAKGRALQEQVAPLLSDVQTQIHQSVSPAEWQAMETTLENIGAAIGAPSQDKAANQ